MATNNADWIQPQTQPRRNVPPAYLREGFSSDLAFAAVYPSFAWFQQQIFPIFIKHRRHLGDFFEFPTFNLIPPVLPKFDWFMEPEIPLRKKNFAKTDVIIAECSFAEIPATDDPYYRRYLNDAGNFNRTINSR